MAVAKKKPSGEEDMVAERTRELEKAYEEHEFRFQFNGTTAIISIGPGSEFKRQ